MLYVYLGVCLYQFWHVSIYFDICFHILVHIDIHIRINIRINIHIIGTCRLPGENQYRLVQVEANFT